jgi:hypothetical protein
VVCERHAWQIPCGVARGNTGPRRHPLLARLDDTNARGRFNLIS